MGQGGSAGQLPIPTWYDYSKIGNTWSKTPLSSLWTSANAPPLTGIRAAVQLSDFDRLHLFASDGNLYRRKKGVWLTLISSHSIYPLVNAVTIESAYHIPASYYNQSPTIEMLTFLKHSQYFIYEVSSGGSVLLSSTGTVTNDPQGPDQAGQTVL